MIEIGEQCRNRWPSILSLFGIDSRFLTGKHGPCPLCGDGNDRFRFDDKDGRGTFFCNQCGAGDGVKFIMLKMGLKFADAATAIRDRLGETTTAPERPSVDLSAARDRALSLFGRSLPVYQDEAAAYLASRGLTGPYPPSLRYNASIAVRDHPRRRTMAAMLALVTDPEGNAVNVHRTYLEKGRKAQMNAPRRMMMGEVPDGAAIRLGRHDGRLGIAEGIETALAATKLFGITCWSAIDAGKLAKFVPPADARELIIFADNDINFTGQAAAHELARRLKMSKTGPEIVDVRIPPVAGTDWADQLTHPQAA